MITKKENPVEGKGKGRTSVVIAAVAVTMMLAFSLPFVFGGEDNDDLVLGDDAFDVDITDMDFGDIASTIQGKITDVTLTGGTVTVGGSKTLEGEIAIGIPAGVTVIWKADADDEDGDLNLVIGGVDGQGAGTFEVAEDAVIYCHSVNKTISIMDVKLVVSGGYIGNAKSGALGFAIYTDSDVTVTGGEIIADGTNPIGIYACEGNIAITGGEITATGTSARAVEMDTDGEAVLDLKIDLKIGGNAVITATGTNACAVFTYQFNTASTITVSDDAVITADGSGAIGIYASPCNDLGKASAATIEINGGEITATGINARAIHVYAWNDAVVSIEINGGEITAEGEENDCHGIHIEAFNNVEVSVVVENGTITVDGDDGYGINTYARDNAVISIEMNGGEIVSESYGYGIYAYVSAEGSASAKISVTMNNGKITTADNGWAIKATAAVNIDAAGNTPEVSVTINGGEIISAGGGIWAATTDNSSGKSTPAAYVTITNGKITAEGNDAVYTDSRIVTISGGEITAKGDGNWAVRSNKYYGAKNELTISGNAKITAEGNFSKAVFFNGQHWEYNSTVNISGNAVITAKGDDSVAVEVVKGILTISGGTITAEGNPSSAVLSDGDIDVKGGTITNTGSGNGVYTNGGDITISNGTVTINGTGTAVEAFNGDVTISGGTITAKGKNSKAVLVNSGDVIIKGGVIEASSTLTGSFAVYIFEGDLTVENGTIKSSSSRAIYATNGDVEIKGGNIYGARGGILVDFGSVTISGGTITTMANNYNSVYLVESVTSGITVTGGKITSGGANDCGALFVKFGNITVTGGMIIADDGIGLGIREEGAIGITGGYIKAKTAISISKSGAAAYLVDTVFIREGEFGGFDVRDDENGIIVEVSTLNIPAEWAETSDGIKIVAGEAFDLDWIWWYFVDEEDDDGEILSTTVYLGFWYLIGDDEDTMYDIEWAGSGASNLESDITFAIIAVVIAFLAILGIMYVLTDHS